MGNPIPVKITSGAYWKPLPDAIPYEASIPLTYKTAWKKLDLYPIIEDMKRPVLSFCGRDSNRPTCQMGGLLEELNEDFVNHMTLLTSSFDPLVFSRIQEEGDSPTTEFEYSLINDVPKPQDTRVKRALDFIGEGLNWCCGVATQRKLDTLVTEEHSYRTQIERLNTGLRRNLIALGNTSAAFHLYSEKVSESFSTMEDKIKKIIKHNIENDNYLAKKNEDTSRDFQKTLNFVFENSRKSLHLLKVFRDSLILQDCKQHRIPQTIIDPKVLAEDLARLQRTIASSDRDLAIPLRELSRYYKLSLADCTMVNEELVVQIRIPIVQREVAWELFELVTTPFAWNNQTCSIMHDTMYLAVSSTSAGKSLRPISGSSLHTCKPYENKLCYIARFNSNGAYGPQCALKMYTGATIDELNAHCAFRCHHSNALIISEVQEDVYVITHPQSSMSVQCGSQNHPILEDATGKPGALEVRLPCNCHLRVYDDIVIPTRYPCGWPTSSSSIHLMHVLPATWSTFKSLHLKPLLTDTHPVFDNFSECLNTNWTLHVPHVNLSTNLLDDDIFRTVQQNLQEIMANDTPFEVHSDHSLLIWNIVLSLAALYLYRQHRILAAAFARFPTAAAVDLSARDLSAISIVTAAVLFIGLIGIWLCWKISKSSYRRLTKMTVTAQQTSFSEESPQLEELHELKEIGVPRLHQAVAKPRLIKETTPSTGTCHRVQ